MDAWFKRLAPALLLVLWSGFVAAEDYDPIAKLAQEVPEAAPFLNRFKGVLVVTGAEGSKPSASQRFKITGKYNRTRIGGSGALSDFLKQVAAISEMFGLPADVDIEVGLLDANNEWDLYFKILVAQGWIVTAPLAQPVGVQFAFKDLHQVGHLKAPRHMPDVPAISAELTGQMYARPTQWDAWLALSPLAEVDNEGKMTFGGQVDGACEGAPNAATDPKKTCKSAWNVFTADLVYTKGGLLKIAVSPAGVPQEIEAAIDHAELRNTDVKVNGALKIDVDKSPGAGLVLRSNGGTVTQLMGAFPLFRAEPFKQALDGLKELGASTGADPKFKNLDIVIAPTGLHLADIQVEPMVRVKGDFKSLAPMVMEGRLDMELKGNVQDIMLGKSASVKGGHVYLDLRPDVLQRMVADGARNIPVLGPVAGEIASAFAFRLARLWIDPARNQAFGQVDFSIFGKNQFVTVDPGLITRPDKLALVILEFAKNVAGDLGKIALKGLTEVGGLIANGAEIAATESYRGVVAAGEAIAGVAGQLGKNVEKLVNGVIDTVTGSSSGSDRNWALENILFSRPHYIAATHLTGTWTEGGNPQAHYLARLFEQGQCPNGSYWFDIGYYLMKHPGLGDQHWIRSCAMVARHWYLFGVHEGLRGSAHWDPVYYLTHQPDVRANVAPAGFLQVLRHFIDSGQGEGRRAAPRLWEIADTIEVGKVSRSFFEGGNAVTFSEKIHVCRALSGKTIHVGSLYMQDCEMGSGTHGQRSDIERLTGIEVLTAKNPQWVKAGSAAPRNLEPVVSIVEHYGTIREVCRAHVAGAFRSGDHYVGRNLCRVSDGVTTHDVSSGFEVLHADKPSWVAYK